MDTRSLVSVACNITDMEQWPFCQAKTVLPGRQLRIELNGCEVLLIDRIKWQRRYRLTVVASSGIFRVNGPQNIMVFNQFRHAQTQ
ncbi:hypothetical protein D3C79_205940 [compost metagenome]